MGRAILWVKLRLAFLLAVLLTASGTAAGAAQPRGFSQGDVDRGVQRCIALTGQRSLRLVQVLSARPEGRNNLAVTIAARRDGEGYRVRCVYDDGDRAARIEATERDRQWDEAASDPLLERAERRCVAAAGRRGLDVEGILSARRAGRNNVEVAMRVRRNWGRYRVDCTYDQGKDRAWLESGSGAPGGQDGWEDGLDAFVDRGVARCREELERRGLAVRRVVSARREGKNNVAVIVSAQRGGWGSPKLRCTWDAGKNRAWLDSEPGPGWGGGSGGDWGAAEASQACVDVARRERLRIVDIDQPVRRGAQYLVPMRVRDGGRPFRVTCGYDGERARLRRA